MILWNKGEVMKLNISFDSKEQRNNSSNRKFTFRNILATKKFIKLRYVLASKTEYMEKRF